MTIVRFNSSGMPNGAQTRLISQRMPGISVNQLVASSAGIRAGRIVTRQGCVRVAKAIVQGKASVLELVAARSAGRDRAIFPGEEIFEVVVGVIGLEAHFCFVGHLTGAAAPGERAVELESIALGNLFELGVSPEGEVGRVDVLRRIKAGIR